MESNVALDKLIHYKIRLAFLKMANSSALVIKLTKNNVHIIQIFGGTCTFRKFWGKKHHASRFFIFYTKQKIKLKWPNGSKIGIKYFGSLYVGVCKADKIGLKGRQPSTHILCTLLCIISGLIPTG